MALDTAAWVAQATAALLDDAPAVEFVPVVPPSWQDAHLAEHGRRLLAVATACDGWPPERTVGLHAFVEAAVRAFTLGAEAPWRMALDELERRVRGIGTE